MINDPSSQVWMAGSITHGLGPIADGLRGRRSDLSPIHPHCNALYTADSRAYVRIPISYLLAHNSVI